MVKINNFGVSIISSGPVTEFTRNNGNYVALKSGSEYRISLSNNRQTICDVDLSVDGKEIGIWRINAYSTIVLERPVSAERKFTFFTEDSSQARKAGIYPGNPNAGLITARFIPKKYVSPVYVENVTRAAKTQSQAAGFSSGVTLLGDKSDQRFIPVEPILPKDIDYANITTIMVRLVVENDYIAIPDLIPLEYRTTPYPPKIDDLSPLGEPLSPPMDYFYNPPLPK